MIYVTAESRIIEIHRAGISNPVVFNKEEQAGSQAGMHPYALKRADLTMRPMRFVLHGTCPWRGPKLNSALTGHERVITELHAGSA
ncbi:MAG TPA: hypothetical protein VFD18_00800 [Chthoniobacterales bacterium]|nr:hypothetical protein [Chthoniobacterales bacterium]